MLNYRLLQQLAPLNFRDERKTESLPAYLERVAPLVPFIPENVLSQWIYRHWRGFESNWSFIDLASHQFTCESWPTAQLVEQVDSRHMEVIERWGEMLRSNRYVRRSWLGEKMLSEGTWPEPVIVSQLPERSSPTPPLLPAGRTPQTRLFVRHGPRWGIAARDAQGVDLSSCFRHLNVFHAEIGIGNKILTIKKAAL